MRDELLSLPMVPLRGLVAFPYTVLNFEIGRPTSMAAVHAAAEDGEEIFLVMQKDMHQEAPLQEDLYEIGVVARVRHIVRLQDRVARVLVEGLYRARLMEMEKKRGYVVAKVLPVEQCLERDERSIAHMRALLESYHRYTSISGQIPGEALLALQEIREPEKLVDTIAVNMVKDLAEKQELLNTLDVIERYEKMLSISEREIQILGIEYEISEKTKQQIEKFQKESYLREQMRAIQNSLGEDEEDGQELEAFREFVRKMPVSEEEKEKLQKEISRLARLNAQSPDYHVIKTYLEWITSMPFGKYTQDNLSIAHASKVMNQEHYGMEKVKERILEYLSVLTLKKDMKGPILCFIGPPGVGKTSIAHSIAHALGRQFVRMSLGGVKDESEIRGHRRTYIGALPGRIASGIRQAGSMNPVFLLDEIDKLSSDYRGDPASAMLEVLDSETNNDFRDNYLDIGLDLSEVLFVATANDAESIPPALYDRMEVIELSSYTPYEKMQIAKRHLIPKQLAQNGMSEKMLKIQPAALSRMISEYTSESGVRALERQIAKICRKAAKKYLETGKLVTASKRNLEEFLGKPRFLETNLPKQGGVGVAIGLAWTAHGGVTLPVEVSAMDGSGELELTGQLGDVMKESAKTAVDIVRSRTEQLGIPKDFHKQKDLHIHVPEGGIPKDGPSAGITITLAVTSALTGRAVRQDFAMTGEVTLTGRVLAIGGLREKTFAAVRAGLRNVIIPKDNLADLEEIPKEIREKIRFWPVTKIEEVLHLGLEEINAD